MPETKPAQLEWLFGLVVHDLRNPAATLAANMGFVRDGLEDPGIPPSELHDALTDSQQALSDLMRGLDQLSFMGRWFNDRVAAPSGVQDLRLTLENARARVKFGQLEVMLPERELKVVGGDALERLIEVLVSNGHQHSQGKVVRLGVSPEAKEDAGAVFVEVIDEGRPLAPEFQRTAFSFDGQMEVRGRADGRYGRVLGLFVASILAQAIDAELSSEARDGKNVFRIRLRTA